MYYTWQVSPSELARLYDIWMDGYEVGKLTVRGQLIPEQSSNLEQKFRSSGQVGNVGFKKYCKVEL